MHAVVARNALAADAGHVLDGFELTLPGTKVPAAPWQVALLVSQSPHSKSMNSTVSPPWIWAPPWCSSSGVFGTPSAPLPRGPQFA